LAVFGRTQKKAASVTLRPLSSTFQRRYKSIKRDKMVPQIIVSAKPLFWGVVAKDGMSGLSKVEMSAFAGGPRRYYKGTEIPLSQRNPSIILSITP
jgi:hypothetical protein